MAKRPFSMGSVVLVSLLLLALLPLPAAAFGAGNIPSIAQIEGLNFRHGGEIPTELDSLSLTRVADIEDMLKTIAFIKGHKWTTMMVKRVTLAIGLESTCIYPPVSSFHPSYQSIAGLFRS